MNSQAFHSPSRNTSGSNPPSACPHLIQSKRLARIDTASHGDVVEQAFASYVLDDTHPCVMARSMVNRKQVFVATYGALGDDAHVAQVCHDLYEVLAASEADDSLYSLVAVFPPQVDYTEQAFEKALWDQLNGMHEVDRTLFAWDPCVSDDPNDPGFSFSIGGSAWYVVGLHPGSSRKSRQFELPALIFNRHAQFTALRAQDRFNSLRDRIRERDVQLQGSVNPMLKDHGTASEAIQYSGRSVDAQWRCPFAYAQMA
jgi:FPC/CPF motif-containing protein YcgG